MADTTTHIRATLPRRGGNSFYKDRRDLTAYAITLCGAAVTDKDISYREAGAKGFREGGQYPVCRACQVIRAANS